MNNLKLSICIPTYNRCNYLGIALDSIFNCLTEEQSKIVEIVVSDNASPDDTEQLASDYLKKYNNIIYSRNSENIGFDRNLLQVISLAKGEYCWILGDDDAICSDSISSILSDITNRKHDILLYERLETDVSFESEPVYAPWTSLPEGLTFNLESEIENFHHYLEKCNSLGGLFSFISVLVFRKSKWEDVPVKDRMAHTGYTHVYMLFYMMAHKAETRYVKKAVVVCRLGNDTMCPVMTWENIYTRLKFDIDGYREIVLCAFGTDSTISRHLLKHLEKLIPMRMLVSIRMNYKPASKTSHPLDNLLLNSGYIHKFASMHIKVLKARVKKLVKRTKG